jgi:hypothetical protein
MSKRFSASYSPVRRFFSDTRVVGDVRALLRSLLIINLLIIGLLK